MHIGLVGLGRMGGNMRDRLRLKGHEVTGYDQNPEVSDVASLADMVQALDSDRRVVWVMVPAGEITESVISQVADLLGPGDVIIDGGNSKYSDDLRRAAELAERDLAYVDAGVSGGIWGETNGYGLMVGGDDATIEYLMPVFDALRPDGPRNEGIVHAGQSATRICSSTRVRASRPRFFSQSPTLSSLPAARLSSCRDSMRAWVWWRRARPDSSSLRSFSICVRSSFKRCWSESTPPRIFSSWASIPVVLRARRAFSPDSSVCAASPLWRSSAPSRAAAWFMRSSRWLILWRSSSARPAAELAACWCFCQR